MRVVDPQEDQELVRRLATDQELVRRLATGLVACWDAIPAGVRANILRAATLSFDPASKRVQLEFQLKQLVEKLQKELA
jgi:hypothetical protein